MPGEIHYHFLLFWSEKKILAYNNEFDKQLVLKEDYPLIKTINLSARYRYRKDYFNSHNVELGFTNTKIADTIIYY